MTSSPRDTWQGCFEPWVSCSCERVGVRVQAEGNLAVSSNTDAPLLDTDDDNTAPTATYDGLLQSILAVKARLRELLQAASVSIDAATCAPPTPLFWSF